MKKSVIRWRRTCAVTITLLFVLGGVPVTAQDQEAQSQPVRDFFTRYLGPPQRLGVLVEGGASADFWSVVFEEDGPTNTTTAEVNRDPYLLVVGGLSIYNLFGYIDWNLTYRTDNVNGALDLRDADVDTGPGRGNTELSSTLQIPLGYVGAAAGALGAPADSVYWLNFFRFQFAPTERLYRWEFELKGSPTYVDSDGQIVSADGPVLFPARYSERRYSMLVGTWPLVEEWAGDPAAAVVAGGSLEVGYMTMSMSSPMQFELTRTGDFSPFVRRQFLTTNEADGFYSRITMGDLASALEIDPEALTVVIWGDFFSGSTTLTTGAFELSSATADPTGEFTNGNLAARRFGFGGGLYKQYGFGRNGNGRVRFGVNAYWHRYTYGPSEFGFISGAFNEWETEMTRDFGGLSTGDPVEVGFFREESFWGVTVETAIRF